MRVLLISLITLFTFSSVSLFADDDKPIAFSQLPRKAQDFVNTFFPNDKVAFAKVEKEIFTLKYDILLVSGCKLEFAKDGSWNEVDCKYSNVPLGIIPLPISIKITELYADKASVIEIKKEKKKYEVKLNNGIELEFDFNYNLLNIED